MLEFHTTQRDDIEPHITIIEIKGRVDSSNASELGEQLGYLIDHGRIRIVMDLSPLIYMSSAGLRELVNTYRKLEPLGGDLRLANPTARVRDVLELSGLHTVLKVFDTPQAAVASY
ncbi:MAG: STAS domain-containing protein [Chloroflexi bacterium]|nr:STAS domain-containing protein [Chloroflexota bacterium]